MRHAPVREKLVKIFPPCERARGVVFGGPEVVIFPPAGRLASRRASDPPPGGAWRGSKRARSARGRCRFRNRNIPMVGGAGFSRCRKNPLVFRLSARRGGHGVQFFFSFFLSLLPSPPGLLFLLGSLPLQDSPLSRIPRSPGFLALHRRARANMLRRGIYKKPKIALLPGALQK